MNLRVGLGPAALIPMPFFRETRQPGESPPLLGKEGSNQLLFFYSGGSLGRSHDPTSISKFQRSKEEEEEKRTEEQEEEVEEGEEEEKEEEDEGEEKEEEEEEEEEEEGEEGEKEE